MKKQRTLSSLLALCLLLTLLPVRAAAENETGTPETAETAQTLPAEESPAEEPQAPGEDPVVELASVTIPEGGVSGQCGDSLTWTLTEDGTLTITGSGAMWDYDDPSTSSSNRAPWYTYTHNGCVLSLVLSDDITRIGSYAFQGGIGSPMIFGELSNWTFSLNLPQSLQTIGDYAFYCADLIEDLVIPESVTYIGSYAFSNACLYTWTRTATGYSRTDNDCTLTMPAKWPALGEGAFNYNKFTGSLHIPEGVESIPAKAFYATDFTTLTLPESIRYIGDYAFFSLGITELKLPARQPDMGQNAFKGCDYVSELVIPEAWTSIPYGMCNHWTRLTSVTLPAGLKEIGDLAFNYCSALTSITFPAGLERIGQYAFEDSGLKALTLPAGLKSLGQRAFGFCKGLTAQPAWPAGLEEVGGSIYYYCENMTGAGTFPSGIGYSGDGLFESTAITSATLAADMTSVPNRSFCSCKSLGRVYIPASVTTIYGLAFYTENVSIYVPLMLKSIYYEGTREDWDKIEYVDVPYGDSSTSLKIVNRVINVGGLHCLGLTPPKPVEKPVYESTTVKRLIRVFDPDNTAYPVPGGFTVSVQGGATYSTGDKNFVTIEVDTAAPRDVTISKSGYRSYTIPGKQVGSSNIVYLYRETLTEPFATAITIDKSTGSFTYWTNLFQEQTIVTRLSPLWSYRTIYLNVNWNGHGAGKAYLWQEYSNVTLDLKEGYNEGVDLATPFKVNLPIYLVLEAADGAVSRKLLKLNVQQEFVRDLHLDLGSGSISKIIRSPSDTPVDVFENQTLGVDFSKLLDGALPVSMEFSSDGTIKGTIGLKGRDSSTGQGFTPMEAYEDLQMLCDSYFEDAAYYQDNMKDTLQKLKDQGLLDPEQPLATVGISVGVQIVGTFEGVLDEHLEPSLTSVKVAVIIFGGTSYDQSYFVSGVPMYFQAGVKLSLELAIKTKAGESGFLEIDGESAPVSASLGITAENGVGNPDVLSGGVQGTGNLIINFFLPATDDSILKHSVWTLNASAAFVGSLVGFEGVNWALWQSKDLVLYDQGAWFPNGVSLFSLEDDDIVWAQASRDYLNEPSEFAINDRVSLMEVSDGTVVDSLFKSNVYPYSVPQIVSLDNGKLLAVWLDDNQARPVAENRTAVYYSVYDGSAWSTPALVNDDGTADFCPVLQKSGSDVYLVWMDASKTFGSGALVDTVLPSMHIMRAQYSPNTEAFYSIRQYNDRAGSYMMPAIDSDSGKVAWVSSPNGVFGGEQEIYVSNYSTTYRVASGLSGVDAIAFRNGGGDIYYSVTQDGVRRIYSVYTGMDDPPANDSGWTGYKPVYVNKKMWWYQDQDGTVRTSAGDVIPAVGGSDWFQPLVLTNGEGVLFNGHDEEGRAVIYISYYTDGAWSSLHPLVTAEEGSFSDISATVTSDGKIAILANKQILNEDYTVQQADLMYYEVTPGCDLAVSSVSYDSDTLVSDGSLTVTAALKNEGFVDVDMVQVRFLDGETELGAAAAAVNLPFGASTRISVDCPLPETLPDSITVNVLPLTLEEDLATGNNTAELSLRTADVALEEMASMVTGEDGTVETTLRVVNRGQSVLEDIPVSLRAGRSDGEELADRQTIASLAPGDVSTLVFSATELAPGDLVYAVAELTDEQTAAENKISNNFSFTQVTGGAKEQVTGLQMSTGARLSDGLASVTVFVENQTGKTAAASYLAALYQDGRMVAVGTSGLLTLENGQCRAAAKLTAPASGDLEVKVFTLDADGNPAADVWTCQLTAE